MLKIISPREKMILGIAVGIFLFSCIFSFAILPFLTKRDRLNKEIHLTETKLRKYTYLLSRRDFIQQKYAKLFTLTKQQAQDSSDSLISTLSVLESTAQNSQLKIIDIRPQSPKSHDVYKEILIELRTEGNIQAYLTFIYNLRHSPSLFKIKRLILTAKPNSQELEASLTVSHIAF